MEFSDTKLNDLVERPKFVRDLDWINAIWPKDLHIDEYPKTQAYCLMGVKNSYTDFHIDFGGTSVFYHILSGEKIFYLIKPTDKNLTLYQRWSSSPDQSGINLLI